MADSKEMCCGACKDNSELLKQLLVSQERVEKMVLELFDDRFGDEDDEEDEEDLDDTASADERDLKRPDTPLSQDEKDFIDDSNLKKLKTKNKKRKIIGDDAH